VWGLYCLRKESRWVAVHSSNAFERGADKAARKEDSVLCSISSELKMSAEEEKDEGGVG